MKKFNIAIVLALALIFTFSSCKKKDNDPKPTITLKSFSFPTTTDLIVELTWNVNGQTPGYNHADLDFYIDDEVTSPYDPDYLSDNVGSYESIAIGSTDANKTLKVGIMYYDKLSSSLSTPYIVNYTITVYPLGDAAAAQNYTGTITASPSQTLIYDQMTFVKSASSYSFAELSTKTTFTKPQ
jgi:hypothetical protein